MPRTDNAGRPAMMALLMAILVMPAAAQARQPVLRISPFTGAGVGSSEASMLERLVASYVVELRTFRVVDAQGQEMALTETEAALGLGSSGSVSMPLSADYIVTGTVGRIGDIYVFTLENTRVSSGEKLSVSDTAVSISDIVLSARGLTRSLFGKHDTAAASAPGSVPGSVTSSVQGSVASSGPAAAAAATGMPDASATAVPAAAALVEADRRTAPVISDISGSWKGDKGLETVRLFANATGLAVLSGGGTMKVRVSIAGDTIEVWQDQPNDVAMYRASSVTLDMARRIAAQARPMRWLFTLSADGRRLTGLKESISISGTGPSMTVDNAYVRDASWTRISR